MKLKEITLSFDSEELEAIHYALEIGIKSFRQNREKEPISTTDFWIDTAEEIRKKLPTKLRFEKE